MGDQSTTDQTDITTPEGTDSGAGSTSSLSDLATSAFGNLLNSVSSSAGKAIQNAVAGTPAGPAPDAAAKAATPGATKTAAVGAISLPILLIGGAAVAFFLMKR